MLHLPVVFGIGPVLALEVPLSRASFESALREGGACKRFDARWDYVVFHRSAEPLLAYVVDNLLQSALEQEITDTFVRVRLATPYTRVRMAACEAKQFGRPLDAQALWEDARTATTISLVVEMSTFSKKNDRESLDDQARYGVPPDTATVRGPQAKSVAIQRGHDRNATRVEPLSVTGGTGYLFPATALQGEGPFYLLIRTDVRDERLTLKLKHSALGHP
jgi:hypothetical protein